MYSPGHVNSLHLKNLLAATSYRITTERQPLTASGLQEYRNTEHTARARSKAEGANKHAWLSLHACNMKKMGHGTMLVRLQASFLLAHYSGTDPAPVEVVAWPQAGLFRDKIVGRSAPCAAANPISASESLQLLSDGVGRMSGKPSICKYQDIAPQGWALQRVLDNRQPQGLAYQAVV
jgi:hypothetical protein